MLCLHHVVAIPVADEAEALREELLGSSGYDICAFERKPAAGGMHKSCGVP